MLDTPAFNQTPAFGVAPPTDVQLSESAAKRRKLAEAEGLDTPAEGAENLALDSFTTRYTSEDNASFSEIMDKNEAKSKQQYWWYYNQDRPASEQQLLIGSSSSSAGGPALITWPHDPKNALMFTPDGVLPENLAEQASAKVISHSNTRFTAADLAAMDPERRKRNAEEELQRKKALTEQQTLTARDPTTSAFFDSRQAEKNKRIDLDDLLGTPRAGIPESPRVAGYGFVSQESPVVGRGGAAPMFTWGDIEGSPIALDPMMAELTTPLDVAPTSGPEFKVPERSARETLGHKLADDVLRKKKAQEAAALSRKQNLLASPRASPRASPLVHRTPPHMSPAARTMAEKMMSTMSGKDSQLRSSYGGQSPIRTPSRTPTASPFSSPFVAQRKASTPASSLKNAPAMREGT